MSELLLITHSEPIPKIFHSEKEKKPFVSCKICKKDLSENDELYIIEKAFERDIKTNKPKLVFELACCMDCREEIDKTLSKESRQKVAAYF